LESQEVERVRNTYSKPYISWKKDPKWGDGKPKDLPFALAFPDKYFKKTVVKRLYDSLPKSKQMQALDSAIKLNADVEEATTNDVNHEVVYESRKSDEPEVDTVEAEVSDKPFEASNSGESF
jgi:hypothetical protein